jgi:hypothetical protein
MTEIQPKGCNPYQADRWREAWAWRCALNEALERQPRAS